MTDMIVRASVIPKIILKTMFIWGVLGMTNLVRFTIKRKMAPRIRGLNSSTPKIYSEISATKAVGYTTKHPRHTFLFLMMKKWSSNFPHRG
jgi:hypothetical protein